MLLINVLTPAGVKVGAGPITTATDWSSTARLDRAGIFQFSMPASDARAAYLAKHNIVVARTLINGTMTELGRGIVDQVRIAGSATPTMLTVSGDDLLRQLVWRTLGDTVLATPTTDLTVSPGVSSLTPLDVHTIALASSGAAEGFDNQIAFPGAGGKPYGYNNYTTSLTGGRVTGNGVKPVGQWIDLTNIFDGNLATQTTTIPIAGRFRWYICYDSPFTALSFLLGTQKPTASAVAAMSVQYYNGSQWVTASGIVDGTVSGGVSLCQDGVLSWTLPSDWVPYQQSICPPSLDPSVDANFSDLTGYWVRIFFGSTFAFPGDPPGGVGWTINNCVDVKEITISGLVPTTQAVAQILGYANGVSDGVADGAGNITGTALPGSPASQGWTLDVSAGHSSSLATDIYGQIQDDTVLAALGKLSLASNEHFRLGSPGNKLVWLQQDTPASGIRAVRGQGIGGNASVCQIVSLSRLSDSYPLITRVRPYGSGNQAARITLANTSRPASGTFVDALGTTHHYTLDATGNWLTDTDAETTYGRIESVQDYPHIGPVSLSPTNLGLAADALYDVALVYLEHHSQPTDAYAVQVVGLSQVLLPGTTLRVVWLEIVDGYTVLDLNADLIILEATSRLGQTGYVTTDLTLSPYPRWPLSDDELLTQLEAGFKHSQRYGQPSPLTGLYAPTPIAGSGAFLLATGGGGVSARQSQT